jgi:hypothetical protein
MKNLLEVFKLHVASLITHIYNNLPKHSDEFKEMTTLNHLHNHIKPTPSPLDERQASSNRWGLKRRRRLLPRKPRPFSLGPGPSIRKD